MKTTVTTLTLLLCVTSFAPAGERMSDSQIKQKLLGYWHSPRHQGGVHGCARRRLQCSFEPFSVFPALSTL